MDNLKLCTIKTITIIPINIQINIYTNPRMLFSNNPFKMGDIKEDLNSFKPMENSDLLSLMELILICLSILMIFLKLE